MIAIDNEHIRNWRGQVLFMEDELDRVADESPIVSIPYLLIEMGVVEHPYANGKKH